MPRKKNSPNKDYSLRKEELKLVFNSGMVVKNYKEMCNILGQEPQNGKSKMKQLEVWSSYMQFHKDGNKFVIDEIRDKPILTASSKKSIYNNYMMVLLTDMLMKREGYTYIGTMRDIIRDLHLTNEYYEEARKTYLHKESGREVKVINVPIEYKGTYIVEPYMVEMFFNHSDTFLKDIIRNSLNSLEKKWQLIFHSLVVLYKYPDESTNGNFRVATDMETKQYLKLIQTVYEKLECENFSDVVLNGKNKEFYSLTDSLVFEKFGWRMAHIGHKIIYNADAFQIRNSSIEEDAMLDVNRSAAELNAAVVERLVKSFNRYYHINLPDPEWGEMNRMDAVSIHTGNHMVNLVGALVKEVPKGTETGIAKFIYEPNIEIKLAMGEGVSCYE